MIDAIVVPRGAEARAVLRALTAAKSQIALYEMGIGARAAASAVDELLAPKDDGALPRRVLVTGLAGLLSPALAVGDALVYRAIAREGEATLTLERELAERVATAVPGALDGILAIESASIVSSGAAKRELALASGAAAVDMESFTVAGKLRANGIATAVLRVASDAQADDLPHIARALDGSGGIDGFALFLAMAREPLRGATMARNGMRALAALKRAIQALASYPRG